MNLRTALLLLVGFVLFALCPFPSAEGASGPSGGNHELMEQWVARKTLVRKKIMESIKRDHPLPKDGRIEYEARVKPDPLNKSKYEIHIDSIRIVEGNPNEDNPGSKPRGEDAGVEVSLTEPIRIPVVENQKIELSGSTVMRDYIEFREIDIGGHQTPHGWNEPYTPMPLERRSAEVQKKAEKKLPPPEHKQSWLDWLLGD